MRHPDCYARLHNLWRKKHNTPFQWGKHDCLALALEAVEAITGETLSTSPYPLPYDSYGSAQRLLKKQPLLNRAEQALKKFDLVRNYASLQSGDLAVVAMATTTKETHIFFSPHAQEEKEEEEKEAKEAKKEAKDWSALAVLDLCASGFVLPRIPKGITRINKRHLTILKAWRIA